MTTVFALGLALATPRVFAFTSSLFAGMPILDVDKAQTVIVIKRSLSPGFAGIPNPLFIADNALMFYSDAKKAILDTIAAIKEG